MIKLINKYGTIITGTENGWDVLLSNGNHYIVEYINNDNGSSIDAFSLWFSSNCKDIPSDDYKKMDCENYFVLKKISIFEKMFGSSYNYITLEDFNLFINYSFNNSYANHCWDVYKYTDDEEYGNDLNIHSKAANEIKDKLIDKFGKVFPDNFRLDLSSYPSLDGYRTTSMYIR